ncbi:FadR/GntR family transcriptional regulator [Azospirillum sp. SYSU D00513]|uniref:FadR/GntR family transcriptional regulator n=1 Tax=Azospirillum sp. SYSU D00513 TaxID=2812561 RepID=UPI001A96A0D9|nr:FadR/GntR family transcriptional regulator [Azospirillum sp. SYSU D00513]
MPPVPGDSAHADSGGGTDMDAGSPSPGRTAPAGAQAATHAGAHAGAQKGDGVVSRIMQALIEHIRSNGLRAGDGLPGETAFAQTLGASRPSVREAFRSLGSLGIIDIGNGRRARVSSINDDVLGLMLDHAVHCNQISVQQVFDFRRTIEIRTAGLAALRRTASQSTDILALTAAMRADFDRPERMMEHDVAFHTAIARASCNPMFGLMVGSLEPVVRQVWPLTWGCRRTDEQRFDQIRIHEAVAQAISAQNAAAAERAMTDHFDNTIFVLASAGMT